MARCALEYYFDLKLNLWRDIPPVVSTLMLVGRCLPPSTQSCLREKQQRQSRLPCQMHAR